MSDKPRKRLDRNKNWSTTLGEAVGLASPDVVDFQPLPIYPLLGVQVHGFRWQQIVEGMRRTGVVVRVHTEMDRAGLFKAASRLDAKIQSRRCDGHDGREASWLVRVDDGHASHAAALDAADSTASVRGRYRALSMVVLEKGSLTVKGKPVAVALHRSLRQLVRSRRLAVPHERGMVTITAGKDGAYTVSVDPVVQAAAKNLNNVQTPAA